MITYKRSRVKFGLSKHAYSCASQFVHKFIENNEIIQNYLVDADCGKVAERLAARGSAVVFCN